VANAIVVDGVSKQFRLQSDRSTSIKEIFTRRGRDKSIHEFWALRDVSFEIPEGSMYALVGHNGSGKSTLLRCIAGIYQPNGGQVHVSGRISTLLELGAGFHPDLSGRENIFMNATMLGMDKRSIEKSFDEIVAFAGDEIARMIDSPVKVYSTGMYVRLGFSVAVHVKPEILIIDEVIAVGDEAFQRRCFDHLYSLRREGTTIVVVTHGLATVETMCDGAAWLDHGQLQLVGDGPEVAAAYLKRVNAAEAASREAAVEAAEEAEERAEEDGAPASTTPVAVEDIELVKVEFLGRDGLPSKTAIHRDPFTIRIHYDAVRPVDSPVFGIALFSASGIHLTGTNTQIDQIETGRVSGPGVVDFAVAELPLTPGEFELSVSIADQHVQHLFVRREREWRIAVRLGGALPPHGLMDLRGDWRTDGP